jgi:hypothetical protein
MNTKKSRSRVRWNGFWVPVAQFVQFFQSVIYTGWNFDAVQVVISFPPLLWGGFCYACVGSSRLQFDGKIISGGNLVIGYHHNLFICSKINNA